MFPALAFFVNPFRSTLEDFGDKDCARARSARSIAKTNTNKRNSLRIQPFPRGLPQQFVPISMPPSTRGTHFERCANEMPTEKQARGPRLEIASGSIQERCESSEAPGALRAMKSACDAPRKCRNGSTFAGLSARQRGQKGQTEP